MEVPPWAGVACHKECLLPHEDLSFQVQIAYPSLSVNFLPRARVDWRSNDGGGSDFQRGCKNSFEPLFFPKVKPVPCFSCWEIKCIPVVNLSRTLAYPVGSDPIVTAQANCLHLYSSRLSLCQGELCGGREWLRSAPKKKKKTNMKITLEEPLRPVDNSSFRPLSRPVPPLIPIPRGDVWFKNPQGNLIGLGFS